MVEDGPQSQAEVLLLTRDLFFGSRITGTTAQLDATVDVEGQPAEALRKLNDSRYRCVILDLSLPGLSAQDVMQALPADNRLTVIAYGAHVHTALLGEARAAGCDRVMPRGQFAAQLLQILTEVLSDH